MQRGGKHPVISGRRPAPSPSSSPSLSPSPSLSSNPQGLHIGGPHGRMRPSMLSNSQEHFGRQLGHMPTENPVPSPSVSASSNESRDTGEEDSRVTIHPYGDSFTEAMYVVRQLNKIVNSHWRGAWISYSSTPKVVKELWWNEFKRQFKWDEIDENEVQRVFKKKAGDHIRNVLNKAKTSKKKPDFITNENWAEMKTIWETEQNKQRSEQNRRNRSSKSGEGSATYAGGSVNIAEHRKRMADETGIEPTYTATFERAFQKKDKTWCGDRAKAIKDKYDELLLARTSGGDGAATSEPSVDSMTLWVEASSEVKSGKTFGLGSLSRIYTTKAAATLSSNAAVSRRTRLEEQVTQEMSHMKDLLVQKDEEIRAIKQQYESRITEMNERYQALEAQNAFIFQQHNLNRNQVPPLHPVIDGRNDDQPNDERHEDDEIADDDEIAAAALLMMISPIVF